MGDEPRPPRLGDDRPPRQRPPAPAPEPSSSRPLVIGLSVLGAAVVIGVVLLVMGSGGGSGVVTGGTSPTTTVAGLRPGSDSTIPGTTLPESEFTTYTDDDAGFSLRYPKSWDRYGSKDPNDHLIAAEPPTAGEQPGNGVIVRLFRTEVPTTSDNLQNIRAFTDGVVGDVPSATVLQRALEINIDGMPGYFYLYTFTDETTGREGAHGHFFLFRGRKAYQVIVEAIPAEGYARLAPLFDQITDSFKSEPDTAPPATTPTTTP